MPKNFTRHPSPNPKYAFVGDNYLKYGEQAGYVYYPWTDEYYIDKNAAQKYGEESGQIAKQENPSLAQQLVPVAAVAGTTALATEAGKALPGLFGAGGTPAKTGIDAIAGLASNTAAETAGGEVATSALGNSIFGGGSGVAPAASGVAEAGATTTAAPTGLLGSVASNLGSLGGLAGAGVGAGVLGGIALGAKGASDLLQGKKTEGLAGWGGRATLGIATGGLSELARFAGLGRQPTTEVEDKKLEDLKAKGLLDPNFVINKESRTRAEQLRDLEKTGVVDEKKRKWLETGDEQYLTGQDLQGYAAFLEKDPKDMNNRIKLAEEALRAGAVNEQKGTVDVDWAKLEAWRKNNQQPQPQAQPSTNKPLAPQQTQQPVQDKKQGLLGAFR
jgi:hypothetical protein